MILESVIDWDSCHADIDARLEWIAFGIQPQNRRMLCDGITQQNHVDVVVKRLFLRKPSALRFHPKRNDTDVRRNSRLSGQTNLQGKKFLLKSFHCRFQLNERRQFVIHMHNETLSVVALRISNPDRSPIGINR